jgi:hypothetical protein
MRFYPVFALFFCINISVFSNDSEIIINATYKNTPITEILNSISDNYNVIFSYSNDELDDSKIISVKIKNASLKKALEDIFDEDLTLKTVNNAIIITKSEINSGDAIIYGYVYDSLTKEAVISALVYVPGTNNGTWTNSYGFYSLQVRPGEDIHCSYVGYKNKQIKILSSKKKRHDFYLSTSPDELTEITISGENFSILGNTPLGLNEITYKELKSTPTLTGESDLIKSLHTISGISPYGDGSSAFFVRGGRHDQNLILIDEAPVYNPVHMFGFFSAFSSDIVNDVKVYKGEVPAKFGGKSSSVINIRMREGNSSKITGESGISPYIGHLIVEGPLTKKVNLFTCYRQSLFGWIFQIQNPYQITRFYDLNMKINYNINDNNKLFLSGYGGYDNYSNVSGESDRFGMNWGNYTGTLRYNHIFSGDLFSNTTFIFSRYNYNLIFSEVDELYWHSYIQDYSLKEDLNWFINKNNTVNLGIGYTLHTIDPGNLIRGSEVNNTSPEIPVKTSGEGILYIGNNQKINKNLSIYYGLRLPLWLSIGGSTEYTYNDNYKAIDTIVYGKEEIYHYYINPEPRISIRYKTGNYSALNLSYSRMHQYLHLLNNSISPFTSMDVWYPSGMNLKPIESDIISAGYLKRFLNNKFEFLSEIYYKNTKNQIEYKDHAALMLNPQIEGELRTGNSESYGLELMLQKKSASLSGWVSYTLSKVKMKIPDLNEGKPYNARWDRPHKFNITMNYLISKRFSFAASWIYASGSVVTSPSSFYYHDNKTIPYYNEKNNSRLPDYHRLDVALTYNFSIPAIKNMENSLNFSIYNLYNRANPFNLTFNKVEIDETEFAIPSDVSNTPYIVPTNLYLLGIVPSISYKLRF